MMTKNMIFDEKDTEQILAILENNMIISITDYSGKIIFANTLFCNISGYSQDELVGSDHRIVNSSLHSKEFWKDVWGTIKAGNVWRGEVRNQNKQGKFYWVFSLICPIYDQNKNIHKYISFRTDITDKKNIEHSLAESNSQALHLTKIAELTEIAASVAHEINNPMSIILGTFNLYKNKIATLVDINSEPKLEKYALSIFKNIDRVKLIIGNLRRFSRIESSVAEFKTVKTTQIIENVLLIAKEKIESHGVEFHYPTEEFEVLCDSSQIEQVLINLIFNSIYELDSMEQKWIRLEINKIGNEYTEFSVTDSGLGITPEIQEKLMRPFFSTKPIGKGTGLGLSNSQRIISEHAGEFYYDSKSAHTRFVFVLPKSKEVLMGRLNVQNAILAHNNWKLRILDDLKKRTHTIDVEEVSNCSICMLGQWILSVEKIFESDSKFQELKSIHRNFHRIAGEIVSNIQSGKTESIEMMLNNSDSEYNHLSMQIAQILTKFNFKV